MSHLYLCTKQIMGIMDNFLCPDTEKPHIFGFKSDPPNTDTQLIWKLWHVPLVFVFTGFHYNRTLNNENNFDLNVNYL